MLVLENGELLHTDSSLDVIEHYGVKGMKWGQRRMMRLQSQADRYREIAKSRSRALEGSRPDIKRAAIKRAAAGYLLGNVPGAVVGGLTVNRGNLKRSRDRFNAKATRKEMKAAEIGKKMAGKEAWRKAFDDKRLNKAISDAEKNYDKIDSRKVKLFDLAGRKQKKRDLKDANDRLYDAEEKLFKNAENKKSKALNSYRYKPARR